MQKENSLLGCLKENKIVVNKNKVILNLVQNLQHKLLSLRNSERGKSRTRAGMTSLFYNGSGFTLIELLVVVLIIGILAAVALPQYQLAVDKARFSKLRALVSSYIQAAHVFYQANGMYPGNIEETDLDFPAGMTFVSLPEMSCAYNQEIYCCINQNSVSSAVASVTCGQKDMTFALRAVPSTSRQVCIASLDSSRAQKLCKAVGGGISADGQTMWPTPNGFSSGSLYRLPD